MKINYTKLADVYFSAITALNEKADRNNISKLSDIRVEKDRFDLDLLLKCYSITDEYFKANAPKVLETYLVEGDTSFNDYQKYTDNYDKEFRERFDIDSFRKAIMEKRPCIIGAMQIKPQIIDETCPYVDTHKSDILEVYYITDITE